MIAYLTYQCYLAALFSQPLLVPACYRVWLAYPASTLNFSRPRGCAALPYIIQPFVYPLLSIGQLAWAPLVGRSSLALPSPPTCLSKLGLVCSEHIQPRLCSAGFPPYVYQSSPYFRSSHALLLFIHSPSFTHGYCYHNAGFSRGSRGYLFNLCFT